VERCGLPRGDELSRKAISLCRECSFAQLRESDRFILAIQMCLPVLPTRSGFGVVFARRSVHGFAEVFAHLDEAVFSHFGDGVAALGVDRREECAGDLSMPDTNSSTVHGWCPNFALIIPLSCLALTDPRRPHGSDA